MIVQSKNTLKPYVLVHEDGSQETVHIAEMPSKQTLKENVILTYFLVGTAVLLLTAYIHLKQINGKS